MQRDVTAFLEQIQSSDVNVRYAAWRSAGPMGAAAVAGLGQRMASPERGVAKAAKGALEGIAHYAARPGANTEARAVSVALLKLTGRNLPFAVRAEALHLLGFTGDSRVVPELAALLSDAEVREEARLALERIPGSAALEALRKAAKEGPADFRPNVEQSLHNRNLTRKTVGLAAAR